MVYAKLVLATVFWGATWSVGRTLVQEVPPFAAAFIRFAIAVACMGSWLLYTEGRWPKVRRSDLWVLLVLGLFGVFLYNAFFLHGLQHIDAARGAMMVALNPVLILLASVALGQERLSLSKLCGISLALAGSVLVISRGDPVAVWVDSGARSGVGEALILGCSVAWTIYTLVGRHATQTMSSLAVNTWACGLGCLFLGAAAAVEAQGTWAWPNYSLKAWASLVFLGVFGTALSYIWYTEGVKKLGPARATVFINLVPLSGVLIATLAQQERLPLAVWLGAAISLTGVALTTLVGVSWGRKHGLGLSADENVTPSLRGDLGRFDRNEGLQMLEVMAASLRHAERLTMQLQCEQHIVPLTVFPLERLVYCPLPMDALLCLPLHEVKVIHIESSATHPPDAITHASYPLSPLLWALAMDGARDALLPEIAGQVAYRVAPSVALTPVRMTDFLLNAVTRLRRETTNLRSLAQWPGMDHPLACRLLNAIYLQSALMVTRSHPSAVSGGLLGTLCERLVTRRPAAWV